MPKPPREERPGKDRPKLRAKLNQEEAEALKASAEAFRRRRNRRYIVLAVIAASFPILEVIAYQYRVIEVTFVNNFRGPITTLKFTYPGGEFTEAELKPTESITKRIRPDFSFKSSEFSTYRVMISFGTSDGGVFHQMSRAGTIDYSAHETFTVVPSPPAGQADLQHTTSPGFPLGAIRELLQRLGIG